MFSSKHSIFVAILLVFGTITVSASDCPKVCTLEFNQVCAHNGEEYRLFSNPCRLRAYNCQHDNLWIQEKSLTPCYEHLKIEPKKQPEGCIRPCGGEIDPICAFDGQHYQLFDNVCELHNAECDAHKHFQPAPFTSCVVLPRAGNRDNCDKACTFDYNPVCGFNGEEYRTFGNPCTMEIENCKDHNVWKMTRMGECKEPMEMKAIEKVNSCQKPCNKMYKPTCGYDGHEFKVFSNPCVMENEHCRDGHEWKMVPMNACTAKNGGGIWFLDRLKCVKKCTEDNSPTCGFDGKEYHIFSNKCAMENQHCFDSRTWEVSSLENCDTTKKPYDRCQKFCPPIVMLPTCGYNGKKYVVFATPCDMDVYNCYFEENYVHKSMEECNAHNKA